MAVWSLLFYCMALVWNTNSIRVAIVGSGITGSSSSYFIREALEEYGDRLELVVFERTERVCGRMRLAWLDGKPYEVGAAVAHPKNMYMDKFADILSLAKLPAASGTFGVTTGEGHFVTIGDGSSSILLDVDLVKRYGEDVVTLEILLNFLLDSFMDIYKKQNGYPPKDFSTAKSLLESLQEYDFPGLANKTMSSFLKEDNFSPLLINELVAITVAAIFNQNVSTVTALSGMTALARSPTSNYWSIRGGNEFLCKHLLNHAGASVHLGTKVSEVVHLGTNEGYSVMFNDSHGVQSNATFDFVVIAAPMQAADITFSGFSSLPEFNIGRFQTTTTTLVQGDLNISFFGLSSSASVPWVVGVTPTSGLPFSLIERTPPADGSGEVTPPVWKVQSTTPLSSTLLLQLYPGLKNATHHTFTYAYPHFAVPNALAPLQLDTGVFYPSGIEWVSSAMEMGCIAGRNTAILLQEAVGNCCHVGHQPY